MTDMISCKRVSNALTALPERKILNWLCAHMPKWITPDILTLIGGAGAIVTFSGYLLTNYNKNFLWIASAGLIINWFGDSLDGSLARYRKIERPKFGFFIDHTTDAICGVIILLGLGMTKYLSFNVACLIVIGYLILCVLAYVGTIAHGTFKLSYGKLGPTELRIMIITFNSIVFFLGIFYVKIPFGTFNLYDIVGIMLVLLCVVIYIVSAFKQASLLSKIEKSQNV